MAGGLATSTLLSLVFIPVAYTFVDDIQRWLVRHPRFEFHFTPTSSSWMNLVERWFAEITTKWIRRGTHRLAAAQILAVRKVDGRITHIDRAFAERAVRDFPRQLVPDAIVSATSAVLAQ